jgi:hypothetical protein
MLVCTWPPDQRSRRTISSQSSTLLYRHSVTHVHRASPAPKLLSFLTFRPFSAENNGETPAIWGPWAAFEAFPPDSSIPPAGVIYSGFPR